MTSQNYQVPDFRSINSYQSNHYEVVLVPFKETRQNRFLVTPLEALDGIPFEIFDHVDKNVNMIISNIGNQKMEMHVPHIVLLRLSPKKDNPNEKWVVMDSALPVRDFAVHNIVEKAMHSWRFDFVRSAMDRLYHTYGEQSMMMLNHHPDTVRKLINLNDQQWSRLNREWANVRKHWHELRVLLRFGFEMKIADFIIDAYRGAEDVGMNRHPFRLAQREIGTDHLSRFFRAMGLKSDSAEALEANSREFLDARSEVRGATAVDIGLAMDSIKKVFDVDYSRLETQMYDMILNDRCDYRQTVGGNTISMGTSLRNDFSIARSIAARVQPMKGHIPRKEYEGGVLPDGSVISLNEDQKIAIHLALNNKTSIITGGPGTGKTTTAKALIKEIKSLSANNRIFLTAPTGKAARRMSDVTGLPCITLHRMLGMAPGTSCMLSSFGENDTLVIDEMSMVDLHLFANAIRHIADRGRLVILGDSDQLAAVESGDVLNDLNHTRRVPTSRLDDVQRQAAKSNIVMGSYSVLKGEMPTFGGDLHFIKASSSADIIKQVKNLVSNVLPNEFGINCDNIQILSSQRVNKAGVYELNREVKDIFNVGNHINKAHRQLGNAHYHVGDRVMYLKNRYDRDVQNGECGVVHSFDEDNEIMTIDIEGKMIKMPYSDYQEINHAWASTVHKSQGSEYDCVIFVMPREHMKMLTRNLIFTAMTRGKKHVFIVAEEDVLGFALKNNAVPKRRTHLSFMVSEYIDQNLRSPMMKSMLKKLAKPHRDKMLAAKSPAPDMVESSEKTPNAQVSAVAASPAQPKKAQEKRPLRAADVFVPF